MVGQYSQGRSRIQCVLARSCSAIHLMNRRLSDDSAYHFGKRPIRRYNQGINGHGTSNPRTPG
jgi:hypothetical protein